MTAALKEAGLPAHDFKTLSYTEAVECKKQIDEKFAASPNPSPALLAAQSRMTELLSLDSKRANALLVTP